MIGQKKLIQQIDDMIEKHHFPRFSVVVGDRGMEHEDVAHYVASKMEVPIIKLQDVKVETIRNMISQAYKLHNTTVFCIPHADDMSVNAKNAILKVVEDTPNRAYFIMCLEDINNTLSTIQSRAMVFQMIRPTHDDIKEFARSLYVNVEDVDENRLNLLSQAACTVGDVLTINKLGVESYYSYANQFIKDVVELDGAEAFKLTERLAIKDEEDKFDCRIFINLLQIVLLNQIKAEMGNATKKATWVSHIGKYKSDMRIKGINKQMLMDMMIIEMRKIWKSQT